MIRSQAREEKKKNTIQTDSHETPVCLPHVLLEACRALLPQTRAKETHARENRVEERLQTVIDDAHILFMLTRVVLLLLLL